MHVRDPGLQPERTSLAWSRTGFSLALVGLLLCRDGVRHHGTFVLAAGAFITLASLGMLVLARWRRRSLPTCTPSSLATTSCTSLNGRADP
ncbi:DUF202 domain-containing protein [Curvibacter delicatus]|uniref:DUF202 domain-containing protein n=1 Tax=Curvibacter delicatus TaxID=80879 RepID=UPI000A06FE59